MEVGNWKTAYRETRGKRGASNRESESYKQRELGKEIVINTECIGERELETGSMEERELES